MQCLLRITAIIGVSALLIGFSLFLLETVQPTYAYSSIVPHPTAPSLVVVQKTPLSSTHSPMSQMLDSTLLAALISFGGVVLSTIVLVCITIYQMRRAEHQSQQTEKLQQMLGDQNKVLQQDLARQNEQLQRESMDQNKQLQQQLAVENEKLQRELAQESSQIQRELMDQNKQLQQQLAVESEKLQRELARQNEFLQQKLAQQNEQLQRELPRIEKELEREYEARKQQDEIAVVSARKRDLAQMNEQRAQVYRERLKNDPRIAFLQIMEMKHPLELVSVYVRLRVYQEEESQSKDSFHRTRREIEVLRDFTAWQQADRQRQQSRFSTALNPEEAIRKHVHCAIIGDPGAGKTTLLRYLALKSAQLNSSILPDLPIYVELSAFTASESVDLLDFIAKTWDRIYGFPQEDAYTYIAKRLEEGKAMLLLDALDETAVGVTSELAEDSYVRVSQAILQVTAQYRKAPIVVTIRKAAYRQHASLVGFTEFEVLDFRAVDIRQFVTNWYTFSQDAQKREKIADLNGQLERNLRIQTLATNPLLLFLIVLVYEANRKLPDRRAELYRRCIDTLLLEWNTKRNIHRRQEFKLEHKQYLLEIVAWYFHSQGRRYFSEDEVLQVIADFLPKVKLSVGQQNLILKEITTEHGLLKEQARGWYGFLHLTLQEYFVAQYAIRSNDLDVLLKHRGDPWWEEAILLYAGSIQDASSFLNKLLIQEDLFQEDLFYTNLLLAGRCLASHPTLMQTSLPITVIKHLIAVLVTTSYSLTRLQTAGVLMEIEDPQVHRALLNLFLGEELEWDICQKFASALGVFRTDVVVGINELIRLILKHQSDSTLRHSMRKALNSSKEQGLACTLVPLVSQRQLGSPVRAILAFALGAYGEREVVPDLVRLLTDPLLEIDVRQNIANALGILGDRSIALDLVYLLANPSLDVNLGQSIVQALGDLGERMVASDLVRLLSDSKLSLIVRRKIAWALGKLGESTIVPDLMNLLSDAQLEDNVRISIALGLGVLGERAIVPSLLQLLNNSQLDNNLRIALTDVLCTLADGTTVPYLVDILSNPRYDSVMRGKVAETLGELGEKRIAHDLVTLFSQQQFDIYVGKRLAKTLSMLREPTITSDLISLLSDNRIDSDIRMSIAEAIGMLGERSVIPDLVSLLSNMQLESNMRGKIAEVLGLLGEKTVAPTLVSLLTNTQLGSDVRAKIAETLGLLGERSIIPDLLMLLSEHALGNNLEYDSVTLRLDSHIRSKIAGALRMLGDQSIALELVNLLSDDEIAEDVRGEIALTIGQLREWEVIPHLMRLLSMQQFSGFVRVKIAEALGILGDQSVAPELAHLLTDTRLEVHVSNKITESLVFLRDKAIIPDLVNLLSNSQVHREVRENIARAIEHIADDEASIEALAHLLQTSDIADAIYQGLWIISKRVGVSLFRVGKGEEEKIKIVRW